MRRTTEEQEAYIGVRVVNSLSPLKPPDLHPLMHHECTGGGVGLSSKC